MTATAGLVTRTAAPTILVESVTLRCDVWATGNRKVWGPLEATGHYITKPLFVGQMANEMATNSADQRPYWKLKREIWLSD
jgi:hypothetical protein